MKIEIEKIECPDDVRCSECGVPHGYEEDLEKEVRDVWGALCAAIGLLGIAELTPDQRVAFNALVDQCRDYRFRQWGYVRRFQNAADLQRAVGS